MKADEMSRPPGVKQVRVKHLTNGSSINLATGSGPGPSPAIFRFLVPASKVFRWRGLLWTGISEATHSMDTFVGAVALTNGLRVAVLDEQDDVVEDFATGAAPEKRTIKTNADWSGLTSNLQLLPHGAGTHFIVKMGLDEFFADGVVDLAAGRSVAILVRDNLSTLGITRITATATGRMLDA